MGNEKQTLDCCDLLTSGQECYCEGTGIHDGVGPQLPLPVTGDYWELQLPGKRKRTKEVGRLSKVWGKRTDTTEGFYPYVDWARANKGRYTGISLRLLLKYGRRVSTKAERDAHLQTQIAKAKAKRELKKVQRTTDLKGEPK